MTTSTRQPKMLQVRAGRIGLPYPGTTDPDAVHWVREDEIRQIERFGKGCIVVLATARPLVRVPLFSSKMLLC